jgi:hypothetical protein
VEVMEITIIHVETREGLVEGITRNNGRGFDSPSPHHF